MNAPVVLISENFRKGRWGSSQDEVRLLHHEMLALGACDLAHALWEIREREEAPCPEMAEGRMNGVVEFCEGLLGLLERLDPEPGSETMFVPRDRIPEGIPFSEWVPGAALSWPRVLGTLIWFPQESTAEMRAHWLASIISGLLSDESARDA